MQHVATIARRGFTAAFAVMLAMTMCLTFTGCGMSPEDKAKEALTAQLDQLKDVNDSTLSAMLSGTNMSSFTQLGLEADAIAKSWLSGYEYEIKSVKIDGDNANLVTSVTCKHIVDVINNWSSSFASNAMAQNFSSASELYPYAGETFAAALDSAEPQTAEVTFVLTKDGDSWKFDQSSSENKQAFVDSMYGGEATVSQVFG